MIGQTVSHYKILEKIGSGGMGVVYKALDLKLHRLVALKFLHSIFGQDEAEKQRFIHEARAASALDHSNICTIHDISETEEGHLFIVMSYYEGESLKVMLERGSLELDKALNIIIQLASGLNKAHQHGIIHLDLKPGNIMITNDGQVKIVDFGLAKLANQTRLTKAGSTPGTIGYMSPEQIRGGIVDHRSDIWSLGVVLYEMVTGQKPFRSDYSEVLVYSISNEEPETLAKFRTNTPMELEHIVRKALSKDPNERHQQIDEMLADLQDFRKNLQRDTNVYFSELSNDTHRKQNQRRFLLLVGLITIVVLAFLMTKSFFLEQAWVSSPKPIAVLSFENQTGDSRYDYLQNAIPNLLITNLEQSKYFRVTTWERMQDLLRQIGKSDIEILTKELAFKLCELDGIEAIVLGSYTKVGKLFATDIKVLDVSSKEILISANVKGEGEASILEIQIDHLSNKITAGIGIPPQGIEESRIPVAEVTTSSMEAYNYFVRGRQDYYKFYFEDAKRALEKAISIDSSFALAYLYLGRTYSWLKDHDAEHYAFRKAKMYAGNTTDKEQSYIEASYAEYVEEDREKKVQILREMSKKYPKEKEIFWELGRENYKKGLFIQSIKYFEKALALDPNHLEALNWCAYAYSKLGNYDYAIKLIQKYASASPGDANPIDSRGELYFHMGEIGESIAKFKEVIEIKPDFYYSHQCAILAYLYALKEEYKETFFWIKENLSKNELLSCWWEGFYYYWLGHSEKAIHALNVAKDLGRKAESDWLLGWIYYEQNELEESRRCFDNYFNPESNRNLNLSEPIKLRLSTHYKICQGLIDLRMGNIDPLKEKLRTIKKLVDRADSFNRIELNFYYTLLQGELFLFQDQPHKTIEICQNLNPLEFGIPMYEVVQSDILYYNLPFPRDVLARAFIKTGNFKSAIAEYERLMAVTDINNKERRLIRPEYHLRLAKLYDETGQKKRAVEHYEKYLAINELAGKNPSNLSEIQGRLSKLKMMVLK